MQTLQSVANEYNAELAGFVQQHNKEHGGMRASSMIRIYDLSNPDDVQKLRKQGYGVKAHHMTDYLKEVLEDPYDGPVGDEVRAFVNPAILEGKVVYDRKIATLGESIDDNAELSALIGARCVQRGICAGVNEADTEFEVHDHGNEGLIPWKFDNLTMITTGYNPGKNTIDRGDSRLVYMPAGRGLIYCLSPQDAHYAPHGIFIMEVLLPALTNAEVLSDMEGQMNMKRGTIYTARNKILASTQGTAGTTVKLVGEAIGTEVIRDFHRRFGKSFKTELEVLLEVQMRTKDSDQRV